MRTSGLQLDGLVETEQAFDVAPDGTFIVVRQPPAGAGPALNVIQGWTRELERQVPVD